MYSISQKRVHPHIFVNILLYLFTRQRWRNDTPCPRWLRKCWKIMVATQNIDTLDIFTWGVLTFVASGLDINGCVLSYFEQIYSHTSCTLTTLHCSKVSFLQCCHTKRYNKMFTKMWGVYSLLWDTVHDNIQLQCIAPPAGKRKYHVLLCNLLTLEILSDQHQIWTKSNQKAFAMLKSTYYAKSTFIWCLDLNVCWQCVNTTTLKI